MQIFENKSAAFKEWNTQYVITNIFDQFKVGRNRFS